MVNPVRKLTKWGISTVGRTRVPYFLPKTGLKGQKSVPENRFEDTGRQPDSLRGISTVGRTTVAFVTPYFGLSTLKNFAVHPISVKRHPTRRRKNAGDSPDRCRESVWGIGTVGRTTVAFVTPTEPLKNRTSPIITLARMSKKIRDLPQFTFVNLGRPPAMNMASGSPDFRETSPDPQT